jgi:nucleoside-diphosphate-sugar epimerase
MRIGIIGLGHIGYPIALRMHSLGHEVHSWTRSEREVPWLNSTRLSSSTKLEFDSIFLAAGGARPNIGNSDLELATTYDLISHFRVSINTKLFFISSGAVYGECSEPQSELDIPNPTTDYGIAKFFAEKKLDENFRDQLTVLRVGNIIDEDNPYGIVAQAATSIKAGFFQAFGHPDDCRDYISVSDFQLCIQRLTQIEMTPRILNLGSGKSISINEIVDLISKETLNAISVVWTNRKPGDVSQTRLNISLLQDLLGVVPDDPVINLSRVIREASSRHFRN